jgi:hypothetical protein
MCVAEPRSTAGKRVDVRCMNFVVARAAHRFGGLIVCHEEEDVWA